MLPCSPVVSPAVEGDDADHYLQYHPSGGQKNRQDDEDDLKDAAREVRTHGGSGGKRVHQIRLLNTEGRVWTVRVDAESGAMR